MALVGVAMLWLFHSRKLAWLLLRSVLLASLLITALKVLFLSCAAHWVPGLLSPSGHACLSAVVYGTLGTVLAAGRPRPVRILIGALVVVFVAVIAVSRVTLGVHTLLEVLVGLMVGALAHWWFARSYAKLEPLRVDAKIFGLALTVTLLVAFGVRLPAESFIRHLARRIAFSCEALPASGAPSLAAPHCVPHCVRHWPRNKANRSSARERAVWS
jgi:membrane-associated phospholipid phosphatase